MCIGPYAQANTVDRQLVLMAGQIALNPTSMRVVASGAAVAFSSTSPTLTATQQPAAGAAASNGEDEDVNIREYRERLLVQLTVCTLPKYSPSIYVDVKYASP